MANQGKKDIWFWLEPYVHISVKNKSILLYNTLSGKKREYAHQPEILKIINKLLRKDNLLVVKINEETFAHPSIKRFINEMREDFMGDMKPASTSTMKPIQLRHMLNIQQDAHKAKKDPYIVGKNLLTYLTEITLYLNNRSPGRANFDPGLSKNAYKQFLFPYLDTDGPPREMPVHLIEKIFHDVKESATYRLNVCGGNIFQYSQLRELVSLLNDHSLLKVYYLYYTDAFDHAQSLPLMEGDNSRVHLVVTFPAQSEKIGRIIRSFTARENVRFIFIITGENQIEECQTLIRRYAIKDFSLQPYYNGKNLQFFRDNVFVTRDDIYANNPSQKEITTKMAVNKNFFGKLTVLSDGDMYANLNASKLGNAATHSVHEMIYKALYKKKSWLKVRDHIAPCKSCLYNFLCPPVSNYEYILGRNNLCHIYD